MKKAFLLVLVVLLSLTGVLAFDVLDDSNNEREYFSLTNSEITVKTSQNISNYTVSYEVSNTTYVKDFNFSGCDENFCSQFSLLDLISSERGSFSGATEFEINVSNQIKIIKLDFEKPDFVLNNWSLNNKTKQIEINFIVTDNSGFLKNFSIYRKEGNNEILVEELVSSIYDDGIFRYDVTDMGNVVLIFKLEDAAGNLREVEEIFYVGDIFLPNIVSTFVTQEDGVFSFNFNIEDDNKLKEYVIKQDTFTLGEKISVKSYSKEISLPFSTGKILFEVIDEGGNVVSKEISLQSSVSVDFDDNIYSNSRKFGFESNADVCYLVGIDNGIFNEKFDKTSNNFEVTLAITEVDEYDLSFYCENNNFRKYFDRKFFYDTNLPNVPVISVDSLDDGNLEITWSKSSDKESDIEYFVFRDGVEIYDGSKLKFVDYNVEYPNEYSYYVVVEDEAGNKVETDVVSKIPNKINVSFSSSIPQEQQTKSQNFTIDFQTDINSDVLIKVKNLGKIVDEVSFNQLKSKRVNTRVGLLEGVNEVYIRIVDEVGNVREESFFVTYEEQVLVIDEPIVEPEEVVEVIEPINETETIVEQVEEDQGLSWWIWFLFWLVILGLFVWYFIVNENELKRRVSLVGKKKSHEFYKKRRHDVILGKNLEKAKKERIRKQQEILREKQKEELKRERTNFEKKKMEDLSSRREVNIPFSTRNKQKKRVDKIRREVVDSPEHTLEKKVKEDLTKKSNLFNSMFGKKEEVKKDSFLEYLQSKKSSSGWDSSNEYVHREVSDVEEKIENVQVPKKEEKSLDTTKDNVEVENQSFKREEVRKISLDEYLNKRTKKKRFYFAEKDVDRDLRGRE